MKTVTIYGYSDDVIEIDGDIRDEFYPGRPDKPMHLAFSDGTVLNVVYDEDGCWRITVGAMGSASMERTDAIGPDSKDYSDRVTLTGDIRWVVAGTLMARARV